MWDQYHPSRAGYILPDNAPVRSAWLVGMPLRIQYPGHGLAIAVPRRPMICRSMGGAVSLKGSDGAALVKIRQFLCIYSSLETELNVVEIWPPRMLTAAMITTAIRAAIKAYSMAVTARLSALLARRRLTSLISMLLTVLSMQSIPNSVFKCVSRRYTFEE